MSEISFPATFPTLCDDSVLLRELDEADIPSWFARAIDAEAADLAGDTVPDSIAAGHPWLERQRTLFREQAGIRWAIAQPGDSISFGTVSLRFRPNYAAVGELGIVLARSHWNKGLGTAATRLVLRYAFHQLCLNEIRAEALQRNPASVRLLQKAGFRMVRVAQPTEDEPEVMVHFSLVRGRGSAA